MPQKLLLLCLAFPFLVVGQNRTYYNKANEVVQPDADFSFYETIEKMADGLLMVRQYTPKDSLLFEGAFSQYLKKGQPDVQEGLHKNYRRSGGALWYSQNFAEGKLHGELRSYYPNGKLKRIEKYEHGQFISGVCYNEDGSEREFTHFERQPSYPGGEQALFQHISKNIVYPKKALENNIQGSVILSFVVNRDGSVSNIEILKDLGAGCGAEAVRVAQLMEPWVPGYFDDQPVKVRYSLPLKFKLDTGRKRKKKDKD